MAKKPPLDSVEKLKSLANAAKDASQFRNMLDENGRPVPPDPAWLEAIEAWLTHYEPETMPYAARSMQQLAEALDQVKKADTGNEFADYREMATTWLALWTAFDGALQATFRQPPRVRRRATPAEMAKTMGQEMIALRMIANEWRWFTEDNAGQIVADIPRVLRELETPGSECTEKEIERREQFDRIQLGLELPAEESVA